MNTIIIEDENKPLEFLKAAIEKHCPEIHVVAVADSVTKAISVIRQYQPDLIFLDVMIKGGTSFDILENLPELDAEIIFTTSYEEFAVRAFRQSAVDYLMKPLDESELVEAVNKAKTQIKQTDGIKHLELLLNNYRGQGTDQIKLALPTFKGLIFVRPEEIIRCESDNTYTTFFLTKSREVVVSKTLKACEELLTSSSFCRVHNRSLVNLKYVESYERGEGGLVVMKGGAEVPVSRRRKEHFLQLFHSP